jgi:hypothetical protein
MPDPERGRRLVLASLLTILALTAGLALLAGASSAPAVRYGRPLIVALSCLLVWQRRLWARWLLVLLGLGILLAGPIALGNNLPPWTVGGALFWLASILYAVSLFILFGSRDARAYLSAASRGNS